ncbi:MAG: hypothetical protein ACHP7B_05265 [Burkholderiales bacterium]
MKRTLVWLLASALAICVAPAYATFHLFRIDQVYSNADGSVQYVVMREVTGSNGQSFWQGNLLTTVSAASGMKQFQFPMDLPSTATASKSVLIATTGFATLGLVTPDYTVPDNFIPMAGGTLNYAGVDQISLPPLPTDGATAVDRTGNPVTATPKNFAGATTTLTTSAPPAVNYEGLWWNSPANSESGWGINFAHQGDIIFATWFTYDLTGKAWWLSMTAVKTGTNVYSGTLFQTTGPAFSMMPFNPASVAHTMVGSASLTFTDANTAQFAYTVNGVSQVKTLTRQVFGTVPTCTFGAQPDLALATNNYQDLWWASPAASESGWGINLTEQSNVIFGTWFTYDLDGTPLWLSVTATRTAPNVFTGTLYRTTGPAFDAMPFDPTKVVRTPVGTATFTFADGNHATFAYTVNGVSQAKAITREVFVTPGTVCQ